MGLFDSVYFTCPTCGEQLEDQSKALPHPYMNRFQTDAVPVLVALDILDDVLLCVGCRTAWKVRSDFIPPPETVPMWIEPTDELPDEWSANYVEREREKRALYGYPPGTRWTPYEERKP